MIVVHSGCMRDIKIAGKLIIFVAGSLLIILSGTLSSQKYHPDVITNESIIKLISGQDGLEDKYGKAFALTELNNSFLRVILRKSWNWNHGCWKKNPGV